MVMVIVIRMMIMIQIPMNFLLPGLLSKAMFNRAQDLHLSGVLISY